MSNNTKTNSSPKLDCQVCFPLYAAAREVIKQYRPYLGEIGLTYTQYVAMLVLWEHESVSVRELCKRLYLDSGTLTPVLKSIEAKGLICRYRSREDERVLIAELTPAGMALRDRAAGIPEKVAPAVGLDKEESVELYSLLYKLLGSLEEK